MMVYSCEDLVDTLLDRDGATKAVVLSATAFAGFNAWRDLLDSIPQEAVRKATHRRIELHSGAMVWLMTEQEVLSGRCRGHTFDLAWINGAPLDLQPKTMAELAICTMGRQEA
jgi:hypothetical protein